jgi:hypothetical protein
MVKNGETWEKETYLKESISPICWAKAGGGIPSEMEGDTQISGEPEAVQINNTQ